MDHYVLYKSLYITRLAIENKIYDCFSGENQHCFDDQLDIEDRKVDQLLL